MNPSIADAPRTRGGAMSRDMILEGVGAGLAARLYGSRVTGEGAPIVLYLPGSGAVDAADADAGARGLAAAADAVVLSVGWRRPGIAARGSSGDDAVAAYRWLLVRADSIGGSNDCIALAGEGDGGELAIAAAIALRDAGLPPPVHVLAIRPAAASAVATAGSGPADPRLQGVPGVTIIDVAIGLPPEAGGDGMQAAWRQAGDRLAAAFATTRPTGG